MKKSLSLLFVLASAALAGCASSDSNNDAVKVDQATTKVSRFACEGFGTLKLRFLGPDTVELNHDDQTSVLNLSTSASGAKYENNDYMFWNKGEQAVFETAGEAYTCQRVDS